MKKIIFLTMVMILGMSSVSFGKSYLCTSEIGMKFVKKNGFWNVVDVTGKKWKLSTSEYGNLFYFSVVSKNSDVKNDNLCLYSSEYLQFENSKSCRTTRKGLGNTEIEVNFNSKTLRYKFYSTFRPKKKHI